jgi:hypothetical protein
MHKRLISLALVAAATAAAAQVAPYAGQQERPIKSLSAKEVADLESGQGMGLAKAAELNGYPGPAHVLEHAGALGLSDAQRSGTQALMHRHKAAARLLGAQLLAAERELDRAFAGKAINPALLTRLAGDIGMQQARLREEHLRTHLEQTALLSSAQIQRYAELRGYTAGPAEQRHTPAHQPKHH